MGVSRSASLPHKATTSSSFLSPRQHLLEDSYKKEQPSHPVTHAVSISLLLFFSLSVFPISLSLFFLCFSSLSSFLFAFLSSFYIFVFRSFSLNSPHFSIFSSPLSSPPFFLVLSPTPSFSLFLSLLPHFLLRDLCCLSISVAFAVCLSTSPLTSSLLLHLFISFITCFPFPFFFLSQPYFLTSLPASFSLSVTLFLFSFLVLPVYPPTPVFFVIYCFFLSLCLSLSLPLSLHSFFF